MHSTSDARSMNNRVALGTVQFGQQYGVANRVGKVSAPEVKTILAYAWSAGIDTLDTAARYGDCERRLGTTGVSNWKVMTKLPHLPHPCPDVPGWVRASMEGSMARLQIATLDAIMVHRSEDLAGPDGEALYRSLLESKAEGRVRKIGISISRPAEIDTVWQRFRPDLVQAPLSVFDRRLEVSGWLARLHAAGTEIHIRSIFLQGLLLMAPEERPAYFAKWASVWERWHEWLRDQSLTPLQACVRFALAQRTVARVVMGFESLKQLQVTLQDARGDALATPCSLGSEDENLVEPGRWRLN